jgi:hypothetical protein
MPKWKQLSFAGGELAPELHGRVDTVKYSTGLSTCLNAIAKRTGPVERRTGTQYICATKATDSNISLVKFVYNNDDTLILEYGISGSAYMRFVKNGEQLIGGMGKRATMAIDPTPMVVTCTNHGLTTGQVVDIVTQASPDWDTPETYTITRIDANSFSLNGSTGTGGLPTSINIFFRLSGVTTPLELSLSGYRLPTSYTQSGSVIYFGQPSNSSGNFKLLRYNDYVWETEAVTFAPSISAPTGLASSSAGTAFYYKVTAVSGSFEESLPSAKAGSTNATSTLTWTPVSGAREYNVYKSAGTQDIFGYIGSTVAASFTDASITIDSSEAPPEQPDSLGIANAVCFYQQRLSWGGFSSNPEAISMSRVGQYSNFTISYPSGDADAVQFTLAGRYVQNVYQMVESGTLLTLTNGGIWNLRGDADGVISPTVINARQITYDGAANVRPIVIGSTAMYVHSKNVGVSDLAFDNNSQSYEPRDLSVYSVHMFENYAVTKWDFHKSPHHCVWAVRDDGTLLGLTYHREQEIWGWHRHETDGTFVDVTTIPESTIDATYFIIARDVNGSVVQYIERMADVSYSDDPQDHWMVDSGASYNGQNLKPDGTTGTGWMGVNALTPGEWGNDYLCQLVSSEAFFTAAEVGNSYILRLGAEEIELSVEQYYAADIVYVRPLKTVPEAFRPLVQVTDWTRCVDELSGLSHLEGKTVVALADGEVIADLTVSSGTIDLGVTAARVTVGLPYSTDIVTLPLDNPQQTIADNNVIIQEVTAQIKSTGVFEAGPDLDTLTEPPMRLNEEMGEATQLNTGKFSFSITGLWQDSGRVAFRQDKPLPFTLLSLTMKGKLGA